MNPKCNEAEPSELFNIFSYIHKDSLLIPVGLDFQIKSLNVFIRTQETKILSVREGILYMKYIYRPYLLCEAPVNKSKKMVVVG